jgi:hypothetical protein
MAKLRCPAHDERMVTAAGQPSARDSIGDPRLRLRAHMLGYGGHFLTKSRRYSVSFGQLRRARAGHRRPRLVLARGWHAPVLKRCLDRALPGSALGNPPR